MTVFLAGCPEAVKQLHLQKPGWLEASAGSGKTYAIEHLVVRLLRENPNLTLAHILLVTFTEKAAGELKEKIRRRLESAANDPKLDAVERLRLHSSLRHFDQASVFTIHAFCMQSLRRFAFEMKGLFDATLMSENAVRDVAQLQLHRRAAQGQLLPELEQALVECSLGSFRGALQRLALAYRPNRGDTLWPLPEPENYAVCETRFRDCLQSTLSCLFPEGTESLATLIWLQSLTKAAKGKKDIFRINQRTNGYKQWWEARLQCGDSLEAWHKVLASKKSVLGKQGPNLFRFEPELVLPSDFRETMREAEQQVEQLISVAHTWHEAWTKQYYQNLVVSLNALALAMENHKTEQGWLTYDDMAWRLWKALQQSPDLIALLRQQFPIAIVDEFQDTDPVQWGLFETLFLQMDPPAPLYLVGDPKQAIYGFRGGDLQTYLRARHRLRALSESNQAMGLSLPANFRSRQDLIEACNLIFAHEGWFQTEESRPFQGDWQLPQGDDRITFIPALNGQSPKQQCHDQGENTAPIWLLNPTLPQSIATSPELRQILRSQWDYAIAQSIHEMLTATEGLRIPDGQGEMRALHAGDICVLYRAHKERLGIERWLRQWGIPYHVYKQRGLFKSAEAGHLAAILNAIARPQDPKSQIPAHFCELLSPLEAPTLETSASRLDATLEGFDVMHPQLQDLLPLASRHQWPVFFRQLFKSSPLSSTRSGTATTPSNTSAEKWTRYQQLAQRLIEAAQTKGLDGMGLAQCLQEWRKSDPEDLDADGDILRSASAAAKVTFLTMHASKGLEFPIVFIAGGFGPPRIGAKRLRHEQGMGWTWFLDTPDASIDDENSASEEDVHSETELDPSVENSDASDGDEADHGEGESGETQALSLQEQWRAEAAQEDRRLFYVALTRAQFKLVMPVYPTVPETKRPLHSPWKGFVGQAILAAQAIRPDLFSVRPIDPLMPMPETTNPTWVGGDPGNTPVSSDSDDVSSENASFISLNRLETETKSYQKQRRGLASYSQLARRRQQMILDEQGKRLAPDEIPTAEATVQPILAPPPTTGATLPPGARTGNFLHACLENLDFNLAWSVARLEDFQQGEAQKTIYEQLAHFEMNPDLASEALRLIWNALRTPLPNLVDSDSEFCLAQVHERLAEVEFMLPFGHSKPLPDMRSAGGYLWGYIDLVFRHGDRYYLLDWKSNSLPNYAPAFLAESMREEAYDLQGRLYALALHRWLQGRLPHYHPEKHFGGVYYLYLRGMSGPATPGNHQANDNHANSPIESHGIAAWRPTPDELVHEYPRYLATYLGVSSDELRNDLP